MECESFLLRQFCCWQLCYQPTRQYSLKTCCYRKFQTYHKKDQIQFDFWQEYFIATMVLLTATNQKAYNG